MFRLKTITGIALLATLGWPSATRAATCSAQARYVRATPGDAKGFKQAVTLAVSASAESHGLISYTVSYKDKSGVTQSKTASVQYKFAGGGAAGATAGGTRVTDETVLGAGACAESKACTVHGATLVEVSCFKDAGGRCSATASYVGSAARDAKGFKQAVDFDLSSGDCGPACHGLVKYSLKWTGKDGVQHDDAKSVSYKMSGGGSGNEVEVTDDTVLGVGGCADGSPCKVTGVTVDKVSCFADR